MKNTLITLTTALTITVSAQAEETDTIKLYTLDCGTIDMFDISAFSSEGHFDGQKATLADPCYLIRHPKGDFLWETGLDQSIADHKGGINAGYGQLTVKAKLTDQLAELGLATADIDYLGLSHWHPDHSGNAGLFTNSTLLLNQKEHEFMFSATMKAQAESYAVWAPLEAAKTITFTGDYDVFGDGKVIIKYMPGHTVGHSALYLELGEAGNFLFSGDLYTHADARKLGAVAAFSADMDDVKTSQKAFEAFAKEKNARIIIQHEMQDFKSLPQFPTFER